jgi:uncharacterized paraquat-inducible protein A
MDGERCRRPSRRVVGAAATSSSNRFSISTWLALTLTAAILLIFANDFPVAVINLGLEIEATWRKLRSALGAESGLL